VQKLSQAKNFQDVVKIQTEFMETQMNSFNEQAKILGEIYTNAAQDAMKTPSWRVEMTRFYEPDLTVDPNSPFVRDASNKLVRRGYWMDMTDGALVMVMTKGLGANLTNDEKRAHLIDLKREPLIDQVYTQEILPPEK
jgi:hypothetical protein